MFFRFVPLRESHLKVESAEIEDVETKLLKKYEQSNFETSQWNMEKDSSLYKNGSLIFGWHGTVKILNTNKSFFSTTSRVRRYTSLWPTCRILERPRTSSWAFWSFYPYNGQVRCFDIHRTTFYHLKWENQNRLSSPKRIKRHNCKSSISFAAYQVCFNVSTKVRTGRLSTFSIARK